MIISVTTARPALIVRLNLGADDIGSSWVNDVVHMLNKVQGRNVSLALVTSVNLLDYLLENLPDFAPLTLGLTISDDISDSAIWEDYLDETVVDCNTATERSCLLDVSAAIADYSDEAFRSIAPPIADSIIWACNNKLASVTKYKQLCAAAHELTTPDMYYVDPYRYTGNETASRDLEAVCLPTIRQCTVAQEPGINYAGAIIVPCSTADEVLTLLR